MKFTDGQWLLRRGVVMHHPAEARDLEIGADSVTIHAPCRPIGDREATVDCPLLTVKLSSPRAEVIRVQVTHFEGGRRRGPEFALEQLNGAGVGIEETETGVRLQSGGLSVLIKKTGGWSVEFHQDGERLTGSASGGLAYIVTDNAVYLRAQLDLGVGECVYGLGERFTPFVKNGQAVEIWNEDGGASTEQAYKNIPFYLTNRGYGVFVNHPERVSFEVASEKVSAVQFSVAGECLDYYLIGGGTPRKVLENYTALTGRPALPPAWSFGLWLSTSFTTDYDEKTVGGFVDGMAARDLPLSVLHFDCFWMREFHWTDFAWDERIFPDPAGMLARLKERGLRICVWINPYIAQRSRLFAEGAEAGYLLKREDGGVWQWDRWQAGMGIVDFTNPAAVRWYTGCLRQLLEMGVDCFKTDFGERIPTDVVYHDGSDPLKMHNYYSYLYNAAVFETLREQRGAGDAVVFARSATAGGQRFPVHWGGDCRASYESMAESLRGGLSLCLSGFGFWSHDIGGFEGTATADLYKRWVAFGLLSTHSRLHGYRSYRVPWLFDEEAVDVLRFFTKLKHRLMPYLFGAACAAERQGVPVMRPMCLEFPADPACDHLDRQYMLGEALLVAPVFSEEGTVSYYLPPGRWTDFLSGREAAGGCWRHESHDYFGLPLLARPNSIIAVGKRDDRPDYDYADGVTLAVFALEDGGGASAVVYSPEARPELTVTAAREGRKIVLEYEGAGKPWSAVLRGLGAPEKIEGGTCAAGERGLSVTPDEMERGRLKISL